MKYFAYSQKAFVYKYIVMLSDTDQFKHMSFANYLKLMYLATEALFISCFDEDFLSKNRLKFFESRMQFKRQTVVGDNILVKVNASEINGARFSLLHTFVIEGSGELVSLGRQTCELVTVTTGQPVKKLPDKIGSLLGPIYMAEDYLLYKY